MKTLLVTTSYTHNGLLESTVGVYLPRKGYTASAQARDFWRLIGLIHDDDICLLLGLWLLSAAHKNNMYPPLIICKQLFTKS